MKKYILTLLCALISTVASLAQTKVTGTVLEPSGETVIGATVVEKGQKANGTTTNIDGKFTLNVSSSNATLVVSYLGMETQEVKLAGRTNVQVTLKSGAVAIDEVVIVGYGTQRKINATGAVKTIGNDVLEARPITNAVQGLQGAVAGLNITNDAGGELGGSMDINIRGVGSIGEGSNSSPLVLIDGMEGDLSTINPNDIENISVLKDAAAASIYGSRAPFGVILVTTKSGQRGTQVNYSGNVRLSRPISVPHLADSYTFALMLNDAAYNSGSNPPISAGSLERILKYQRGEIDYATEAYESDKTKWKTHRESWGNSDWYDIFLKDLTTSTEHNMSVSGGGDKVTYYLSANYLGQTGMFNYADEKYQRLSLSSKINVKFNKYVTLNWQTRLISTDNKKPSALNELFYHNLPRREPTIPMYLPNGEYHPDSMIGSLLYGGDQNTRTQQLYNQANLVIEPIKNWKLHAEVNSRIENNPYTRQFNPISYTRPDGETQYYQVLATGASPVYGFYSDGSFKVYPGTEGDIYYEKRQTNINYFSTNFYTDYLLKINDKHEFKFLVGMQTEYYKRDITRVANMSILSQDTPYLPQTSINDTGTMVSESKGEWSSVGVFGRINYNYADRYMAEINMRGDGASRFPSDQRWGFFPSFSAGWNIAEEKFFEPLKNSWWQYFKLRASYGTLGNQNTTSFYPYYQSMTTTPGTSVLGGNQVTTLPMYSPYSASLTWETIENVGAGVDLGMFNSRLMVSFDWYQRKTKDMVGPALALSQVYGADAPKTNNAELRTRGWELELSWRDRIGKDFSYGISASLSDYKSVVTKYDSPDSKIDNWYQGKEYGEIWGYRVLGIAQSDDEMTAYLAKHAQGPSMGDRVTSIWGGGDLMYMDVDNNGEVTQGSRTLDDHGDLCKIGNTTPRYAYSFTLEAQWKWIDFRAYFQGIGKRDYFISGNTFFGFGKGEWQNSLYLEHLDYFRLAGSPLGANTDSYYARIRWDANNQLCSDRFLQNASYLRLKNLQIGFSLPKTTKLAKFVKKARLYLTAENLFTITSLRIYDPEALSGGDGDYSDGAGKAYPMYQTYSVGLELTF